MAEQRGSGIQRAGDRRPSGSPGTEEGPGSPALPWPGLWPYQQRVATQMGGQSLGEGGGWRLKATVLVSCDSCIKLLQTRGGLKQKNVVS